MASYCQWLKDLGLQDTPTVGGKCSSLGEMYNQLTAQGIRVPNAFVLTVDTYREFLTHNQLDRAILQKLAEIDYTDLVSLKRGGLAIRNEIINAEFPPHLETQVLASYRTLSQQYSDVHGKSQQSTDVAVRSSSLAEDSQECSFAGQYDTFLNVRGDRQLIEAIKGCYASLYNNRAISYRHDMDAQDPEKLAIAVVIQKMVRSDCGKSGVMFTVDTESGFENLIVINASYGLCELIVQGSQIKPDEFILNKEKLAAGYPAIIDKRIGNKTKKMIYSDNPAEKVRIVPVGNDLREEFSLSDENILELGNWALKVQEHYAAFYGPHQCYDIEFAYDGLERQMYLVQVRPETVHTANSPTASQENFTEYKLEKGHQHQRILSGISVGKQISTGTVRVIMSLDDRGDNEEIVFHQGDILVTTSTDPDWEPLMKKASGIIADCGGRTSHASIVSRELGVNCIVGTGSATTILRSGQPVTLSCAEGDVGYVYDQEIPFQKTILDLESLPKSPIPLMMNLASPEIAFRYAKMPHQGVGLAREEFIINNFICAHPLALLDYDQGKIQLSDTQLQTELKQLIRGYSSGRDYYVQKLTYGIARIATAMHPHPVIVRFSDFKSNEYANLLGGKYYEPSEENPMLGWRGCSRYYSPEFQEAFGMECLSIKQVRDQLGLTNVIVMLPFCRTLEEFDQVSQVMKKYGLERGKNDLQVYLMCEIPSNVLLADEFCQRVDGFSIGSNDLTQLTLGIDRDSEKLSHLFNENHPAVRKMILQAIQTCKKHKVKIGICGQGPSDNLEFAEFLLRAGIDTISLTPDSIIPTLKKFATLDKIV